MSIRLLAVALTMMVPVSSPAFAFEHKKSKAPKVVSGDPNEKICERSR